MGQSILSRRHTTILHHMTLPETIETTRGRAMICKAFMGRV
jgi:hypothetical protein